MGPHQVTISSGDSTIHRSRDDSPRRDIERRRVDRAHRSPPPGWLALASPVELTLAEDDQIIGTTEPHG